MIPNLLPTAPGSEPGEEGITTAATGGAGVGVTIRHGKVLDKGAQFVHGEAELTRASGIHLRKLQKARVKSLKQGEHWDLIDQRVVYSEKGLAQLLGLISGAPLPPAQLAQLVLATLIGSPATTPAVDAQVMRFWANPHLLRIRLPDGCTADLRVKETKNFRPGMTIPVRWNAHQCRWDLARRLPRFPGRW